MSFETLLWVRKQGTGNAASRSVLRVLADHAGQDHSCYLLTRTIADETDLSEAGVRKALARLVETGLVRVYERYRADGGRRSNRFQLLPDGPETLPPDHEDWAGVREAPRNEDEAPLHAEDGTPLHEVEVFPSKESPVVEATPVKGRAPRPATATRVPEDFAPTDAMKAWFVDEQLQLVIHGKTEHEKFMDYWRAVPGVKGRKLDWPATWRNWMRSAADRAQRNGYVRPVSGPPGTSLMPSSGAPLNYRPSTTDQKVSQTVELGRRLQQQMEEQK